MTGFIQSSGLFSLSVLSLIAVFVSAIIALVPLFAAGSALGIFRYGWQSFGDSFRRLPNRKKVWGTVYDARNLRPLPFAVVKLFGVDERLLERRVSDARGRYGFLTTPESLGESNIRVSLEATLRGYIFPSNMEQVGGMLVYGEPYRGARITAHGNSLINFDIPMDPEASVTEFKGRAPSVAAGIATAAMADAGLWIGLVAVPLAFALEPNPFTLGVTFIFAGVASLRLFGIAEHPYGTVSDATGQAIPFALVELHDDSGSRVTFTISDDRGRYVLSADAGGYVLDVRTPAHVQPPRKVEQSYTVRRGWITEKITL